jgi:hypothetical protein
MPKDETEIKQPYYRTSQIAAELGVQAQTVTLWGKALGIQRWRFPGKSGIWYKASDVERLRLYAQRDRSRVITELPWLTVDAVPLQNTRELIEA